MPKTLDTFPFPTRHLKLPEKNARAGWIPARALILSAMDWLQIELPVLICYSGGKGYTYGTHHISKHNGQNYHRITLYQDQPTDKANESLWHELAHAMQAEKWANATGQCIDRFYRDSYRHNRGEWGASYWNNYYEIEARKIADNHKDEFLVQ